MIRVKMSTNNRKKEIDRVLGISGENIKLCMQCGKCSASCPSSSNMDILPHQIIRLFQVGNYEKVLNSQTIWNCASCFTCGSRCPRNIDITKLMEAVRVTVVRNKGESRINIKELPEKINDKMPHQVIVSAFRKYNK
ncbi:MAG: 4Fe-4S dicluster domain-containing protein [Clostridia bacterium]|nr:4Fe-4S dicluster domain-containing protein [Clostridia bacterium]